MATPDSRILDIKKLQVACEECSLHELCLPLELQHDDMVELDRIIHKRRPLHRGDYLFRMGDPFRALYAVRSGCIKTYTSTDEGEEQVTGFHLPGELVGLDAITEGCHPCAARALETTSVCEIPYDRLEEISSHIPGLQRQLLRLMSREILTEQDTMIWLGKKSAEARLAALLVRFSESYRRRRFSPTEFHLSMSRTDIASYLGLAVETVSRLFTRFQSEGLLEVERKHLRLLDLEGLRRIAGIDSACLERHC